MKKKNLKKVFLMEQLDPALEQYEQKVESAINQVLDGISEYYNLLNSVRNETQDSRVKEKLTQHMKETYKSEKLWSKLGDELAAMTEKMGPEPKARLPIAKDKERKIA